MKLKKGLRSKQIEERVISVDQSLFEFLYEKYSSKLFGFLICRTGSHEKAEELLMKVFLKIWEQIAAFDENEEKKVMIILFSICRDHVVLTNHLLASKLVYETSN
ncbi:MAG: hypothetical protein M3139_12090 [Bacteroidota bacterium]|nr:hypothetical protein [Bacteroidota bacterium]